MKDAEGDDNCVCSLIKRCCCIWRATLW